VVALSRPEFDVAVRDALRAMQSPQGPAGNPLTRSRLVVESGKSLADVLAGAADLLLKDRGGHKRHRAVTATYFNGSPTQEAVARSLGIPFSTYRRHLVSAVDRMSDLLWHHELNGIAVPAPANGD
jgi:hypothetical protein